MGKSYISGETKFHAYIEGIIANPTIYSKQS